MSRRPAPLHPVDRSLHLVDLDNLVAGPWNRHLVAASMGRYLAASDFHEGDHLVVAAEVTLARTAFFELPASARLLVGHGPDGADRRLLAASTPEFIASHYEQLVIGSGDHCFADVAREVKALGTAVTAVALQGSMSYDLGGAADKVHLLPVPAAA